MSKKTQIVISLNNASSNKEKLVVMDANVNVEKLNISDLDNIQKTFSGEQMEKSEKSGRVLLSKNDKSESVEERLNNIRTWANQVYTDKNLADDEKEKGLYYLLRAMFSVNQELQVKSSVSLPYQNLTRIIKNDMDNFDTLQIRDAKDSAKHLFYDIRCWDALARNFICRGKVRESSKSKRKGMERTM